MTRKLALRLAMAIALPLVILVAAMSCYSAWLSPSGQAILLIPQARTQHVQPQPSPASCRPSLQPDAPASNKKRGAPAGRVQGQEFQIRAPVAMERLFVVESSQILAARLFVATDGADAGWQEAPRWPAGNSGFHVNPAFNIVLEAGREVRLLLCYRALSGMQPLFSVRTVGSVLERLGLHVLVFGAMLAALPLTLLYASSLWRISRDETIPLILVLVLLAAGYSGWIMGLYGWITPEPQAVAAAKLAHGGVMVIAGFALHYLIRVLELARYFSRRLLRAVPLIVLIPLPVMLFDHELGQQMLLAIATVCALLALVASIAAMERDRHAGIHVAVSSLFVLICFSYILAWFGRLPSDWVTALASTLGIAFAGFLGLAVLRKLHDRDRYLAAQITYSDRTYRREAKRHTAARLRAFASINHDMRQPVMAIGASLALLQRQAHDPFTGKIVNRLIQASESLSSFVDGLLDVARLEAGAMVPHSACFPLDLLLSQLAAEYRDIAAAKGLELRHVPCRADVCSDRRLLERILRNLLSNAISHTGSGRILLGCRRRRTEIDIQVLDTGAGIDPAIQERMRDTGYLPPGPDGRAGLGLFIVTELAAMLGHRIEIKSKAAHGSCFSVTVGRMPENEQAAQFPALRVLGVQNASDLFPGLFSDLFGALHSVLAAHGGAMSTAANRRQALDLLVAGDIPDVAVVCHRAGHESGLEIVEHLEQVLMRPIPAVVLADGAQEINARNRLDRLVLYQPAGVSELLRAIHALANPGSRRFKNS